MKLQNFNYKILAQKEAYLYRVILISETERYEFRVQLPPSINTPIIVSKTIAEYLEEDRWDDAMNLRNKLASIFMFHKSRIDQICEPNPGSVMEIYVP